MSLRVFLVYLIFVLSHSVVSDSLRPHGTPGYSVHGVSCHVLLQRIFPTQGLNPGPPHCRQSLYHLSHQRSHLIFNPINLFKWLWIKYILSHLRLHAYRKLTSSNCNSSSLFIIYLSIRVIQIINTEYLWS